MRLNVTGFKLRTSATTQPFGMIEWPTGLESIGHSMLTFDTDETASPPVVFEDEEIHVDGVYRLNEGWISRRFGSRAIQAVVEVSTDGESWDEIAIMDKAPIDSWRDFTLSARIRLKPNVKAFRVRVREKVLVLKTETNVSRVYSVRVLSGSGDP